MSEKGTNGSPLKVLHAEYDATLKNGVPQHEK